MVVGSVGRIAVGVGVYVAGAVVRGRLQAWQQKKLNDIHEAEFKAVQNDWEKSVESRLKILADSETSESAEWLNTLSNVLWDSVIAPITEEVVPPFIRYELELVLAAESDEHASIPGFLKDLLLEEYEMETGAGVAPFRVSGFRIITDKKEVKKEGDFLLDVGFEVLASKMKMVIIAVIDNVLSKIINKVSGRDASRVDVRIDCSEVRMNGNLRLRIRPTARLIFFAFTEAPDVILAMTMTLQDKLTGFKKEVPLTAFPAIPTLLNKIIQLAIADFMVWPRYYLFNLTPPEALGMNPVPTPEVGYINVKILGATGLESGLDAHSTGRRRSSRVDDVIPRLTYMWGIPSRSKRGKNGTYDPESQSWTWPKGEGFSGQIAGGALGDLITFIVYCPRNGKIGEQQVKVVWAPEGSTLFYWSDEKELPVQMLGGLHTSICAERGIETTQKVGFIDAWVPIEKTKGKAKLHFTAQVEWQYDPDYVRTVMKNNLISSNLATSLKAKAGITKVFTGGGQGGMAQRLSRDEQILGQAAFLSLAGSATMEPMYFVTVIEARDVGLHGTSWTCSIMNTENEVLGKTGAASGPNPAWDAEFDISYEAIRVPNVKLVVHKVSEGIRLRPHIENPLSRLACVSADADAEDAGGAIYEGSIRMAQLVGHRAKTFWVPLIHLDEMTQGKYPATSPERVKIADVPSSMELLNDPGIKVRAGLYYRKQT